MKITIQCLIVNIVCFHIPTMLFAQYQPQDKYSWDYWFARNGDIYHAFYLQYPINADQAYRHTCQTVGHAVSKDLRSWVEQPTALIAIDKTWNDVGIATGSTVFKDGKWWIIFTGKSTNNGGMGLAYSDDLFTWVKYGNEPIIPFSTIYKINWKGQTLNCVPLADPYIYPEKIGKWYFMVLNSQVVESPVEHCGCMLMLKSDDLINWQTHAMISYPEIFERMETPQMWQANGRWYLYFGGVNSLGHKNFVYTADKFDGVYTSQPWSEILLPDRKQYYIAKIVKTISGCDVYLTGLGYHAISAPYMVDYDKTSGEMILSIDKP